MTNYNINEVQEIARVSQDLHGYRSGLYIQLNYDIITGKIWGNLLYDIGHNNYIRYDDDNVIRCGDICNAMTPQDIIDDVLECYIR